MYSLKNDYSEGAHPQIMEALLKTNLEQSVGYGEDEYCAQASRLIKDKIKNNNVDVHFIPGGTQTNLTAIGAFLRPYEACISCDTGHINTHETGAIEATGHKVITVKTSDGKLRKEDVISVLKDHTDEHMVKPKLVYISNSTEIGTVYTKNELKELRTVCDENNLILFMDGARLGSALATKSNDLYLDDIASMTDAFYIGGTKNGALFGEALVICNDNLKSEFRYHIKQRGAMLAKGRLLGIQFVELFRDNLFYEIGKHENEMADIIRDAIDKLGYKYLIDSESNQIFPILPNSIIEKLQQNYIFVLWSKEDERNSCIRLVTSWATKKEDVEGFVKALNDLSNN
ncbi:MAG: threonine aldolase family protein [Romboutsia sp.]|uniref:threonine aldolase family protein n=1 Tax=Romboutsia sp. TaxID=1965302 RepID=UPI003F374CE2